MAEIDDLFGDGDNSDLTDETLDDRLEARKKAAKDIKDRIKELDGESDEVYMKSILREVVSDSMEILAQMKTEFEEDPSPRMGEVIGITMSTVTNAVDSMNKMNVDKVKLTQNEKKIALQRQKLTGKTIDCHGNSASEESKTLQEHLDGIREISYDDESDTA
jgi:hypothetical protein